MTPSDDKEDNPEFYIESVREDGRRFRPSDWIERISATLGNFGLDHRLHYADSVRPCMIEGEKCLLVSRALAEEDPEAFQYIINFAEENHLRIQKERRAASR
ncbi:MAG: DUF3579 domain-containing protein [Gammaproteobacteria bacterium]|nr:DUF3579 domain-containing protein [Gammaproteobacteria bacterium]